MGLSTPAAEEVLHSKVDDLLSRWPSSASVFIAHRMACIGCTFGSLHTVQQACDVYGLDPYVFAADLIANVDPPMKPATGSEER
jgi:hybrid cluster-associated redox disulfide protein